MSIQAGLRAHLQPRFLDSNGTRNRIEQKSSEEHLGCDSAEQALVGAMVIKKGSCKGDRESRKTFPSISAFPSVWEHIIHRIYNVYV